MLVCFFCFSLLSPVLFLSGQAKLGSGFQHRTRFIFFGPLGGHVSFFLCLGAFFSLKSGGILPQPAKICLAFLRPARCARILQRSRSAIVRSFLGFGVRLAGGSLFSSLSLSLVPCCSFVVLFWRGHTFSNAPSLSGSIVGLQALLASRPTEYG